MSGNLPGKLHVGDDGRVRGSAHIGYNTPWPCPNGSWGSGAMRGVVMHTMVGNLPGTISVFNNPEYQASAHFGIAQDGSVHQFGPIGKSWVAWAEVAGNAGWYSIEHADNGSTENPLTDAQMTASAQIVECLSAFAGFPLEVTDSTEGRGYGTHVMGGMAWGGHTCPGPGPRAGQRHEILRRAKLIREGSKPVTVTDYTADGVANLHDIAFAHGKTSVAYMLRLTVQHYGKFPDELAGFLNDIFAGRLDARASVPKGTKFRVAV